MYTPTGYNASSLFSLMTSNNVQGELSIVFSNGSLSYTLTGDDAMSVTITSSLTDNQAYGIGNFSSKQATMVLLSESLNDVVSYLGRYTNIPISISFRIASGVFIPMGVFYANPSDVISTEGVSCTLTAYDSAYYLTGYYEPSIQTWPVTPTDLIGDIISQQGEIALASDAYSGLDATLIATEFCLDPTISSKYYADSIEDYSDSFQGDGSTDTFNLTHEPYEVVSCKLDGVITDEYYIEDSSIVFDESPASGMLISVEYTYISSKNVAYNHEQLSYRQAIAHTAFLMGCNAIFDREGSLKFVPFVPESASRTSLMNITPDHYAALAFSKASNTKSYIGMLDALYRYLDEEGEEQTGEHIYTTSSEFSNTLTIDTVDISTSSIADIFGEAVLGESGIDYQGYDLSMLYGFPYLDCGDAFTLTDYDNNTYAGLPIFSITHTYNGSFSTSMSADALEDKNVEASFGTSYKSKMDSMSQNISTANANAKAAQIAAGTAWKYADEAHLSAIEAEAAAVEATTYANNALAGLATLESVVDTVNWFAEHKKASTDTSVNPNKTYYTYDAVTGTLSAVTPEGTENPSQEGWWELDEAIANYVATHVATDDDGLYVVDIANGWRILVSSGGGDYNAGVYIIDPNGATVQATTVSGISFSDNKDFYFGSNDAYIWYDHANDKIIISGDVQMGGDNVSLSERIEALQTASDNTLIYDHTYTYTQRDAHNNPTQATFTAIVYQGGVDIHTDFNEEQFTWYRKTEDGEVLLTHPTTGHAYGYQMIVDITQCGYGAEIIGKFTTVEDANALTVNNRNLTTVDNEPLTVRSNGDSVRVRDLSTTTTIFPTDKIMLVGAEDEHLVTIQTLEQYLNANLTKQVRFDTTANWNSQTTLVSEANTIYIYTDHGTSSEGYDIAGIKVGDGLAYVVDLPFIDEAVTEHIADSNIHVTPAEKAFWNNKVRCYLTGTEQLIFTTL